MSNYLVRRLHIRSERRRGLDSLPKSSPRVHSVLETMFEKLLSTAWVL